MIKAVAATVLLASSSLAATAAELLMFEDRGCGYCKRWHAEIGPGYAKSAEGRRAPLRRVDLGSSPNGGISLARPVTITPTFVLASRGREVGRVVGYPGADFFYSALDEQLNKLRWRRPSAKAH